MTNKKRSANERLAAVIGQTVECTQSFFLKKWAIPGLFFFIFVFSIQLIVNKFIKFRQWLDSNRGPLVSEATPLPTEPQPLPNRLFRIFVPVSCGRCGIRTHWKSSTLIGHVTCNISSKKFIGPGLTEFRIDRMAFSQSERTCLSIQNVPLLWNHVDSVNPKFGQSGVYQ